MRKPIFKLIPLIFLIITSFSFARTNHQNNSIKYDKYGYPIQTVPVIKIRQLLLNKEYSKLNSLLDTYQKEFEEDFHYESKLFDAYNTFSATEPTYQSLFDEWVKKYPNNYQPYLARAFYLTEMGWENRGYGWAKDTSKEQFAKMELFLNKAKNDINTVIKIEPKSIGAYYTLIRINGTMSADGENEEIIKKALKIFPYSFLIRSVYQRYLRPIWGGSYLEMDNFAEEAQKFVNKNSRLVLLKGSSYAERGWRALDSGFSLLGIYFFNKALSFGEDYDFYIGLTDCYLDINLPGMALPVINKSVKLNPLSVRSYAARAKVYYKLGQYNKSINDIHSAYQIMPNYVVTRNVQLFIVQSLVNDGYKLYKSKKFDKSISIFTWAIKMKPDYYQSYYWRGQAYSNKRQLDLAFNDYNQAIILNPRHFDSYLSIDWVLCHTQQWDQIINYWNKYIELEPEDGRAYRERGGAYYHKGDFKAALADAKKAGELGDAEGQRQYNRLKKRLKQQ